MSRTTIAPGATAHLEDIYGYTYHRWGAAQADKYSDSILDAIDKVAAYQLPWRAVAADVGVEGYFYRCGAHFIYWRTTGDGDIRVVAILHQQMHQLDRLRLAYGDEP